MCNREVVVKALGFLAFLLPYVRKNLLLAGYVGNGFCKQTFGITTVTVPLFYFLWLAKKKQKKSIAGIAVHMKSWLELLK